MQTPPFNPNPSAKSRFQESSENIRKHQAMIQLGEFQRALDFATLEYARILAEKSVTPQSSAEAAVSNRAVHEFIIVLKYLGEKAMPFSAPKIVDNLPGDEQARRQ